MKRVGRFLHVGVVAGLGGKVGGQQLHAGGQSGRHRGGEQKIENREEREN